MNIQRIEEARAAFLAVLNEETGVGFEDVEVQMHEAVPEEIKLLINKGFETYSAGSSYSNKTIYWAKHTPIAGLELTSFMAKGYTFDDLPEEEEDPEFEMYTCNECGEKDAVANREITQIDDLCKPCSDKQRAEWQKEDVEGYINYMRDAL